MTITPIIIAGQNNSPNHRSPFWPVFVTVFLITVIISTAVTFILPETYASTTRIKVEPDVVPDTNGVSYDPYFIQTTFEIIQSQLVLDRVIDKLNLNVSWGRKYFNGETLKSSETLQILKNRLSLAPVRGTKLIAITAYSDDRVEAAQMANAVAEAYQEYRSSVVHAANAAKPGIDARMVADSMVVITDKAEPGLYPVRPNKPLNIALGVLWGLLYGTVAGGLVKWWRARANRRAAAASVRND